MTSVEVAIRFFERHLKEDILKYGERQAIHMAIAALREQSGSFQNGNDHNTVKDWPPYMDLPREEETVTKCHDLYDEDGGEILNRDVPDTKGAKTNADHIRSMTDEELAEWLFKFFWGRKSVALLDMAGWLKQHYKEDA